ncbi:MAG: putative CdaR family transcriptional regulator, partial [Frankiales bacterium]|nr:putative CdaR family transcriptional regulator [Frankiales bacterium]
AGRLEEEVLAGEVSRLLRVEVLATRGSEGVMLLVEAPADVSPVAMVNRVKEAVRDACLELDRELIVGVSAVTEPTGLPRAYRAAREVALCVDRFTEKAQVRVLAVDDLGPARLFVANSDVASVRAYVDDILGPLLAGGLHTADLIVTLHCYFDASRSVRASSAQLGVHENTVRLRLARVRAVTGLDVLGDASDQLSVQTALVVLRLQGHPALPALGDRTEDRQREQTA